MSKHPGPWTIDQFGQLLDGNGKVIARTVSTSPETRAVLLHAEEMFAALQALSEYPQSGVGVALSLFWKMSDKIEAEIAAGKGTP